MARKKNSELSLLELLDDFQQKCIDYACETGPDRDYRKWAKEAMDEVKTKLITKLGTINA